MDQTKDLIKCVSCEAVYLPKQVNPETCEKCGASQIHLYSNDSYLQMMDEAGDE